MKLRITGQTESRFKENLILFLNMATMICNRGIIPTQHDIDTADRLGRWWVKEEDNRRYNILGGGNNHWLNIREEGPTHTIVEFNFRYDSECKRVKTISELMLVWLDFVESAEVEAVV